MIARGGELSGRHLIKMGKNAKDFSDSLKDVKMALKARRNTRAPAPAVSGQRDWSI